MIKDHFGRFQADIFPQGIIYIEGYWQEIAIDDRGEPRVVGPLARKLSAGYPNLLQADKAALAFPAFQALAVNFAVAPFSTIADLLWELRKLQEQAPSEPSLTPQEAPISEPPFEGAP